MLFLISAHLEMSAKNGPDARHQVVDHILAVHGLLVLGGILVSVFSPSPFWRAGRESVEFQNWIQTVNAQAVMCRRVLFGRVAPCSARKMSKTINQTNDRLHLLRQRWNQAHNDNNTIADLGFGAKDDSRVLPWPASYKKGGMPLSRNHIRLETEQQKQIYGRFRYLAERYGRWEVWADFITMSACSLFLSDRQRREEEYVNMVKRYKLEEIQSFVEMFALTIEALEVDPNQDFLEDLFMRFDLGSTWKGQFFTAYHICELMSKLTAGDLQAQLEQQTWISVCDPAVGAGALLIAFAQECINQKVNYQSNVLFVGQDVDRTAAMMSFVQLSLLGCPRYIIVGDSLLNPAVGPSVLLPVQQEGQEIWCTPMYFTDIWHLRIAAEKVKLLGTPKKGEAS